MKYNLVAEKYRMYKTEEDIIKENANCPETEKTGHGPGSCGGSKNSEKPSEYKAFTDAKKQFSLGLSGTTNENGKTKPVIELTLSKPVTGNIRITKSDIIKSKEGVIGVIASKYSDIAKNLKQNRDVFIGLQPDAIEFINKMHDAKIKELTEQASKIPVNEWTYSGEGSFVISPVGVDTEFRPDLQQMEKEINKYWSDMRYDLEKKSKMNTDRSGYRWYNVKTEDIIKSLSDAKQKEADRETKRNTPEAKAKRDAENARMSKIRQHWQDMEDMERSRE